MKPESESIQIPLEVYQNLVDYLTANAPTDIKAETYLEQLTDIAISIDEHKTETNTDIETDNVSLPTDIYQFLRNCLKNNRWETADSETTSLIGKKGDLKTIDELWTKYSDGRFGLSIQSQIWQKLGGSKYPSAEDFGYQGWMESGDVNDPYGDIERTYNAFVGHVGWYNWYSCNSELPPGYYPKSYIWDGNDLKLCKHLTFIIEMQEEEEEIHRKEKRQSLLADPNGVKKYGSSKYSTGQKVRFLMKGSKYEGCIATVIRAVNSAFVEVEFDDDYRTIQSDNKFEPIESV